MMAISGRVSSSCLDQGGMSRGRPRREAAAAVRRRRYGRCRAEWQDRLGWRHHAADGGREFVERRRLENQIGGCRGSDSDVTNWTCGLDRPRRAVQASAG